MSFVSEFNALPLKSLLARSRHSSESSADSLSAALPEKRGQAVRAPIQLSDFATLLSPGAGDHLEALCRQSQLITQQRFGKIIRLFAPLYLSNECINNCDYCGFSRDNPILRVTLSIDEVVREARALKDQGFRSILLVAGEHPKFVSSSYLVECIRALHSEIPGISLEVGPMETDGYRPLVAAGAEALVVYQETYDRTVYARVHTAGPKKDFDWRLETPERAYAAGFRRLGIGALHGLSDWRLEAICLAAHADYLLRNCWKAQLTIAFPRLRPCAGEFEPLTRMTDRELVQIICAFRLMFPDVGMVLSTRERAKLRNGLIPLGITSMSAGSHTEPGGYTGAGRDNLHLTERGRIVELAFGHAPTLATSSAMATRQFDIADQRSPEEVAETIRQLGYEPVWKDWDAALT